MNRFASDNPFGQQHLDRLHYRFPDRKGWRDNLQRMNALSWRATIVGARGSGKSTLLRELCERLNAANFKSPAAMAISDNQHPIPSRRGRIDFCGTLPRAILLDIVRCGRDQAAAEISRRQQRQQMSRHLEQLDSGTVLLVDGIERLTWLDRQWLVRFSASREKCAGLVVNVHRPARSLSLPDWVQTSPSVPLLIELLHELGVDSPEVVERAKQLFNANQNNVRAVMRSLYDDWATGRV